MSEPEDFRPIPSRTSSAGGESAAALSPVKRALQEIRELRARLAEAEEAATAFRGPIAIVGAGMRFPGGVRDADTFWELLAEGRDAITEIPRNRWDWRQYFDRDPASLGTMYAVRGGFLEEIDTFDAEFFGISPREAAMLDPQQRLVHEVAWHALENAGIAPGELRESAGFSRTGIFLGLSNFDYYRAALADDLQIDAYVGSGNSPSMAAGRLAYTLGVHGPAMTVDTSCSSSLAAVHLAVQSLRLGESDLALAGGVNVILAPQMHIGFSRARMLSPDGLCKTFDAAADGYVRSEGCGVVVLKRLADAERDGDRVLAVIRGSAMNHDGRSGGLTAPSSRAQAALLREAYAKAGVSVDEIGLIEAHGTGTSLGDPIEMDALGEVFRGIPSGSISVGSVKTNLGHTEAASGMAGLLKAVLALQKKVIPAHLHWKTPTGFIPWGDLPLSVAVKTTEWALLAGRTRRLAGVSSFGFSGTNAHVVLEEFVGAEETGTEGEATLVVISGRNPAALAAARSELRGCLLAHPEYTVGEIGATLMLGRTAFAHRAAWVAHSREELLEQLRQEGRDVASTAPALCFLFTGQGSERGGMGLELLAKSREFRTAVEQLDAAVVGTLGLSIAEIWANKHGELQRARFVQPALYAYGWALSELWRTWGVEPQVVMGHSLGEYVAATLAGVMTPEEGIRLVTVRGRLTEALAAPGGMVAVSATVNAVQGILDDEPKLSIAAVNAPGSIVLSGQTATIERVEQRLRASGLRHKRLRTTHGFHSAALEGMLDVFETEAAKIAFKLPEVRWISNLTGAPVGRERPVDARYWRRHLRETVQFEAGLGAAFAGNDSSTVNGMFLELGAEPQLLALANGNGIGEDRAVASICKGGSAGEWEKLLEAAARLYTNGVKFDWKGMIAGRSWKKLPLPGYPFQRVHFWFDDGVSKRVETAEAMAAAAADQAATVPIGLDVARIEERQAAMNRWAVALMFSTLRTIGCFVVEGDVVSAAQLVTNLGVAGVHERLMARWLRWLAEEGLLIPMPGDESSVYYLSPGATVGDPAELWSELQPLLAGDAPMRNYLGNCAAGLLRVVRGELSPLETLFPGGDGVLAKALFEHSPGAAYVNRIAAAAIAARARIGVQTAMGFARRLRVLHVGAGTGATTAAVLQRLAPGQVIYTFSDVSEVFVGRARQRFQSKEMEFVLFNLNRDEDADAHAGRYDVVLIDYALRASNDVGASLERVRRVLQPGGALVLLETTGVQAWHDVSTGLIQGQHESDDQASAGSVPGSTVGSAEYLKQELGRAGFVGFNACPDATYPTHWLGLQVIVAHRDSEALEGCASEEEGVDAARSRRGPASATIAHEEGVAVSESTDVAGLEMTVRKEAARILGMRPGALPDGRANLADLGLDSLMAVTLRNRLQSIVGQELSATFAFEFPTAAAMAVALDLLMWGTERSEDEFSATERDEIRI